MVLTTSFGEQWFLIGPNKFIHQPDAYNCGPNALLKLMHVVGRLPPSTNVSQLDQASVRRITMGDFRSLLNEVQRGTNSCFTSPQRNRKERQGGASMPTGLPDKSNSGEVVHKTATLTSLDGLTQDAVVDKHLRVEHVQESRNKAVAKRKLFRRYQQDKMLKQRKQEERTRCPEIGSVVVMEMDKRDVTHARGLVGIVVSIGRGAGIEVLTEAGVIGN
jgi:hypothetical protein